MNVLCVYLLLKILVNVKICVGEENFDTYSGGVKLIELIPDIYNVYLETVKQDKNEVTRRLLNDNNRYILHINKLREVNGIKTHNVLVTQILKKEDHLIYINNPVESQIPYAFLTEEQFKKHLINEIKKQQIELENQKIKKYLNLFKIKPKKNENHIKPFVWRLHKTPTESNLIDASEGSVIDNDDDLEDLPSTSIAGEETTTDNSRDLFIAMLNGETIPTVESFTNETTTFNFRSISGDPAKSLDNIFNKNATTSNQSTSIKNEAEPTLRSILEDPVNHTDSQNFNENITTGQQEELNTTVGDIANTMVNYGNTSSTDNNNTTDIIIVTDTSASPFVTETSEVTTTKSTPKTRGRPFVFMGEGFQKE